VLAGRDSARFEAVSLGILGQCAGTVPLRPRTGKLRGFDRARDRCRTNRRALPEFRRDPGLADGLYSRSPKLWNAPMTNVQIRVEHKLGRAEALARIRRAADGMGAKAASYVRSAEWSDTGAVVVGNGFDGRFVVSDVDVTADVELGWKLSFFPLKVQREAEVWLADLLR